MLYACPGLENEFFQNKGTFPRNLTDSITVKNDLTEEEKAELNITLGLNTADLALDTLLDYFDADLDDYAHEISLLINMLRSGLLLTDETERQMLLEELEETFTTDEDYLKEHEDDEEIRQLIKKTINEANEDFKDMNKDSKKTLQ